eukprot:TRINITY_DN51583_c0_g1_i1.p1 TRINITY_DN51583_c0_g1~~TRINITY_DN51583_c0_g1_i1.p1  ORF type:complete len:403 (+),score=19.23 TRINITY_DN51583_c0_g1_i1:29-1237(+)
MQSWLSLLVAWFWASCANRDYYHVVGNKILNHNEIVSGAPNKNLRGFSLSCTEYAMTGTTCWGCEFGRDGCGKKGGPTSFQQMLSRMLAFKPQIIRIPVYADTTVTHDGFYNPTYRMALLRLVNALRRSNVVVIVDLHWAQYKGQLHMAPKGSTQIWKDMATVFKQFNDSGIWFELYNEPHFGGDHINGSDWSLWLHGNGTYDGMQQLYDAVRDTGADNIAVVGGLAWAYDLQGPISGKWAVRGSNLVYNTHPYNNGVAKTGHNVSQAHTHWNAYFADLTTKAPVLATEFGQFCCPGGKVNCTGALCSSKGYLGSYNAHLTEFMNSKGISWMAWAWDLGAIACSFPAVAGNRDGTFLFTPGRSEQKKRDVCGCSSKDNFGECGANWAELWPKVGVNTTTARS